MRNKRFGYISEKGFTLIELMLVLVVIGILAVVTVPQYRAIIDHYYLQSSANILADELRNAKQLAMDRRENMAAGVTGSGSKLGMQTMDKAISELLRQGLISPAVAREKMLNSDSLHSGPRY